MAAKEKIDWSECPLVEVKPGVHSGAPVLLGTRMPVDAIVDNFDYGLSVAEIVERTVRTRPWNDPETSAWLGSRIPELESGKTNPFAVAQELVSRSGDLMTGRPS